mgnify:CR=1 FL=1
MPQRLLNCVLYSYKFMLDIIIPSYDWWNSFPFWEHGGAYAGDDDATPTVHHITEPLQQK